MTENAVAVAIRTMKIHWFFFLCTRQLSPVLHYDISNCRFAKFVEGESHISAQEITLYDDDMSGMYENDEVLNSFISEDDDSLEPLNQGQDDDKEKAA